MRILDGLFLTFEGGEGSGKSTQVKKLFRFIKEKGFATVMTREPGGTDAAEAIRKILLSGDPDKFDKTTETLLYLAARSDHWHQKILPLLNAGHIVLCDRFQDSSVVYQGIGKGFDLKILDSIFRYITCGRFPDRTYLIMVDPKIGLQRSLSRNDNDETRFENMDLAFHQNVYDGFCQLYEDNKERFLYIDGTQSMQQIFDIISQDIEKIIARKCLQPVV